LKTGDILGAVVDKGHKKGNVAMTVNTKTGKEEKI